MREMVVLVASLLVASLLGASPTTAHAEEADASRVCLFVDLGQYEEDSQELEDARSALASMGWVPDPSDNREALYAPSCSSSATEDSEAVQRAKASALTEEIRALRTEVDQVKQRQDAMFDVLRQMAGAWNELLSILQNGGGA